MDLTNQIRDKLFCVKAFVWHFSQDNNLQDELTIEESIFASDNETLKVIEAYEKALENPEDEEAYQKLLTEWTSIMLGILKRNTSKSF
jgi:hypothetical protein